MYVFSYLLTYILSTFTADFIDRQLISLIDNEINTSSRVFSHLTKQTRAALLYHPGNSQPLNDQSGVTIVMYRKIYLTKTNGFLDIFFFHWVNDFKVSSVPPNPERKHFQAPVFPTDPKFWQSLMAIGFLYTGGLCVLLTSENFHSHLHK